MSSNNSTKNQNQNQNQKNAWYSEKFAIIPLQALLDKRIGPRQLKVLIALAHHANREGGECFPGRARIAEMCGFYLKGKPHEDLVSSLISNPGYADIDEKTGEVKKSVGPGLVELGYVVRVGQRGRNKTNSYRLKTPEVAAEYLNEYTDRRLSKDEYQAKRKAEEDAEALPFIEATNAKWEEEEKALKAQSKAADILESAPVETSANPVERVPAKKTVFNYAGEEYTLEEVNLAYFDNNWGDIPRTVVEYFGYSYSLAD